MQTGIFKNGECILSFDEYDGEPLYFVMHYKNAYNLYYYLDDNKYLACRNMTKDIADKLFSGSSNHDIFEYIYNLNKLETVDTSDLNDFKYSKADKSILDKIYQDDTEDSDVIKYDYVKHLPISKINYKKVFADLYEKEKPKEEDEKLVNIENVDEAEQDLDDDDSDDEDFIIYPYSYTPFKKFWPELAITSMFTCSFTLLSIFLFVCFLTPDKLSLRLFCLALSIVISIMADAFKNLYQFYEKSSLNYYKNKAKVQD